MFALSFYGLLAVAGSFQLLGLLQPSGSFKMDGLLELTGSFFFCGLLNGTDSLRQYGFLDVIGSLNFNGLLSIRGCYLIQSRSTALRHKSMPSNKQIARFFSCLVIKCTFSYRNWDSGPLPKVGIIFHLLVS